jgi:(p)ppGpp synthase/HD superfamily hydrolase
MDASAPVLGARFEEALVYAARLHARQLRKNTAIPYISHLLSVTALVIQDGGSEDEAIAALLHDAPEDQGGEAVLDEIRTRFGGQVASIVEVCSDTFEVPKPPWRERKEEHIARLRGAPPEVRRVVLADKLHNARSILRDLRQQGESVWEIFNGGKEGTLWYYRTLLEVLEEASSGYLLDELRRVVAEIERVAEG